MHRDVIGWLKEWDKCVFHRANPPKKRKFDFEEQENIPIDPLGRPRDRVSYPSPNMTRAYARFCC